MTEKQQPPLPSPEVVRDLVKVGIEQIRVRQQELEIQEKDNQRQFEFAREALAVQAEDRRDARNSRRKRTIDRYIFVAGLLIVAVGFIVVLCYMGKDELAKEISKLAATFLAGGLSGYGIAKSRSRREAETEEDDGPDASS